MANEIIFPDRQCEVCERKGGGRENGGPDNVVVARGHQLCGHHRIELENWLWGGTKNMAQGTEAEAWEAIMTTSTARWITAKKARAVA